MPNLNMSISQRFPVAELARRICSTSEAFCQCTVDVSERVEVQVMMEGAHVTVPESVLFGILLGYVLLGYRRRSTYSSSRRSSLSSDVLLRFGLGHGA